MTTFGLLLWVERVRLVSAEQARTIAESKLRHADRLAALGTLSTAVAHEINNPLAAARLNLQLLGDQLKGPAAPLCAEVLQDLERVAGIVRDLRGFAHQDDGDLEPVAVSVALDGALRLVGSTALKHCSVTRSEAQVPPVLASVRRLEQVFVNLLLNAAHALRDQPAQRGALEIRVDAPNERCVRVEIADDGPGIPDEIAASVVKPFATTKAVGEGTGLGLFVCKGILTALGGSLELLPRSPSGTRAVVCLPVAPTKRPIGRHKPSVAEPSVAEPAAAEPAAVETAAVETKARLLLVEDEPSLRRALARQLCNYEVVCAADGVEALAQLSQRSFDLILCDLVMPNMGGLELLEELEAHHREHLPRLVFMTGAAPARDQAELATRGYVVLPKPFSRVEVEQALERARASRA